MKKITLLITFLFIFIHTKAQTLHLIMVSDYANASFGKVTLENEINIEQMFGGVSDNLGYKINKVYLNTTNKLFSRVGIITSLNNLKPNPEDIVIFYYNGFGTYPSISRSEYPTFSLNNSDNKTLSLDDVATQLSAKNNRMSLVVADIRNTKNVLLKLIPEGGITAAEQLSKVITQKIFLEQSGIYKLVSAKKGMPSYEHFTKSFTKAFSNQLDISESELIGNVNFESVINSTQTKINTYIYYSEIKTPQEVLWSFTKFNKRVKSYQPPYFNIPTPTELKTQMELLVNPVDMTERGKIESKVRALFTPEASIEVLTVQGNNPPSAPIKMSLEQYIQQTTTYDAIVKRTIEFRVFDFTRTADFKKFSSLRITEKIN